MLRPSICLAAICLLACSAQAMPADQYLRIRRQSGYDARLTYALAQSSPSAYSNRVIELRGSVDGFIRRDQNVSFLLTLSEEKKGVLLETPPDEVALVTNGSHQPLRVLARVAEGNTGNVLPLQVIAIAYDSEVSSRERELAPRRPARRQTARVVMPQESVQPSRGYSARRSSASSSADLSPLAQRSLSPEAQSIYPVYRRFIWSCNRRLTAGELDTITVSVLYFAQKYRIDPRLIVAVIIAESDFDPRSTSNKGCMGLGQLTADEARANHLTNPYDPIENIGTAVSLLRGKLDRYRTETLQSGQYTWNQVILALAAYNAGPGAVKKYGGVPPYRETQGYIKRIIRIYTDLCRGG